MRKLSDKHERDIDGEYRATIWEHNGKIIEINQDEHGYHIRINGDSKDAMVNLSEDEVKNWMKQNLGIDVKLLQR